MNIRQELLTVIEQLPDQQLSTLLELALCLKGTKNSVEVSQANHPLQTRSVSLERFSEKLGVLEETILEEVVLALAIITQYR